MAFAFRRKTMAGAVVLVTTVSMAIAGCATNDPESVNSPSKSAASAAQSSKAPASKLEPPLDTEEGRAAADEWDER